MRLSHCSVLEFQQQRCSRVESNAMLIRTESIRAASIIIWQHKYKAKGGASGDG